MALRATPAQRNALNRLPLTADAISKDKYRRVMWVRLVAKGWAEWTAFSRMLVRSSSGRIACARSQGEYEDMWSAENEKVLTEREET